MDHLLVGLAGRNTLLLVHGLLGRRSKNSLIGLALLQFLLLLLGKLLFDGLVLVGGCRSECAGPLLATALHVLLLLDLLSLGFRVLGSLTRIDLLLLLVGLLLLKLMRVTNHHGLLLGLTRVLLNLELVLQHLLGLLR